MQKVCPNNLGQDLFSAILRSPARPVAVLFFKWVDSKMVKAEKEQAPFMVKAVGA